MSDVVVIGGGLAGAAAAVVVREAGLPVTLVRKAAGATALSSGALDALAPDAGVIRLHSAAAAHEAVRVAWARLANEAPGHPLVRFGGGDPDLAREAWETALARVADLLAGTPAELADGLALAAPGRAGGLASVPGVYATAGGDCRFADRVQAVQGAGELAWGAPGPVRVASLPMLSGWSAGAVVEGIRAAVAERRATGVDAVAEWTVAPAGLPASVRMQDLARFFDTPEGEAALLASLVRPEGPASRCILFPPVLGFRRGRELVSRLEGALGAPCAEVLATSPSVPGFRLHAALEEGLRGRGVEIVAGAAAPTGAGIGLRIHAADGSNRVLEPRAVVLATGKFLGGGLSRATSLRETVFGLPVHEGGRPVGSIHPMRLTVDARTEPQPILRAGVPVDDGLRPLGEGGTASRAGLFAAGAVVADWAYPERGCGLGVAALLGAEAAARALAHLGMRPGTSESRRTRRRVAAAGPAPGAQAAEATR